MGHTPGPWKVEIDSDGSVLIMCSDGAHRYYIGDMEDTCTECHANARLIAAAPDLLEACRAFIEADMQWTDVANAVLEQMEAAIAKAEGREP